MSGTETTSEDGNQADPADSSDRGMLGRAVVAAERHVITVLLVVLLVAIAVPFVFTPSVLFTVTLVFIYGILAFAAIIPIGYAGQLILCQGAFFGIGAYTFVKATTAGFPAPGSVVLAIGLTAMVAYVLGRPAMKTGGIYLGILTLAFNELFSISLDLFSSISGGSKGLSSPTLLSADAFAVVPREVLQYYLLLVVFTAAFLTFRHLLRSEMGWAFLTVKEDRIVAESLGIDSTAYRLRAFTLAGAVCGLAGALYAPVAGYITPTAFALETTIDVILTGVIGGLTAPIGAVFGPVVVVLLPELLRFVQDIRLILYGGLLIVLLIYLPGGIGGLLERRS